jgi:hypothetical protein
VRRCDRHNAAAAADTKTNRKEMHKEVPFTGPSKPLRQAPKKTAVVSTGSGDSGGGVHGQRCQFEGVGEAVEEAHGSRVQTGSVLLRDCHLTAPHGASPSWPSPDRPKDARMGAAAAAVVACEGVQVRIGFGRGARIVGSRGGAVGWDRREGAYVERTRRDFSYSLENATMGSVPHL